MEYFYEFKDWIYQIDSVEWLVFAAVIFGVNLVISFYFSGQVYVFVKGCVQKLRNQTRFWALSFLPGYGALRL